MEKDGVFSNLLLESEKTLYEAQQECAMLKQRLEVAEKDLAIAIEKKAVAEAALAMQKTEKRQPDIPTLSQLKNVVKDALQSNEKPHKPAGKIHFDIDIIRGSDNLMRRIVLVQNAQ